MLKSETQDAEHWKRKVGYYVIAVSSVSEVTHSNYFKCHLLIIDEANNLSLTVLFMQHEISFH